MFTTSNAKLSTPEVVDYGALYKFTLYLLTYLQTNSILCMFFFCFSFNRSIFLELTLHYAGSPIGIPKNTRGLLILQVWRPSVTQSTVSMYWSVHCTHEKFLFTNSTTAQCGLTVSKVQHWAKFTQSICSTGIQLLSCASIITIQHGAIL